MCTETIGKAGTKNDAPVITRFQATQELNGSSATNTVCLKILNGKEELIGAVTNSESIIDALIEAISDAVGVEKEVSWKIGEQGELTFSIDGKDLYVKDSKLFALANAILVLVTQS
ncbi:hypothetical protein AMJ47_02250 [Parcubacteria bacterium DG_72]|nr:MAG: hypothetical protein AMJ47_02250 [Parcubacteria bacterium DG_72]